MNGKERITEMVEVFNKQKEEFTEKLKKEFNIFFKEFFEEHPEIPSVSWTQYTPYFNDGESCEFGVYFYDLFDNDDYDEDECVKEKPVMTEEQIANLENIENDLCTLLESIPEEIYKDMFGDHCKIVATSEGFDVQEYEHD